MNLEHFIYYSEVYRSHSINKASEELNISQQRLSAIIKQIEEEFNSTFFVRSKAGIYPTPEGDIFYQYVKNVLQETMILKNKLTIPSNQTINKCCVGISSVFTHLFGKQFYKLLNSISPDTFFDISTVPFTSFITDAIKNFDIIITGCSSEFLESFSQHSISDEYYAKTICNVQLGYWVSKYSPLANRKSITNKVLQTQNFCQLKNISNENDAKKFLSDIHIDIMPSQMYIAATEDVMINLVEKFNYVVQDVSFPNNQSLYADIFANTNTICKTIPSTNYMSIIAKKEKWEFLYPLVSDIIFYKNR